MSRAYEDNSLWRTAFGARTKDRHADQRKSLELAYRQFRDALLPLLRQTAVDLPALTIHDETHVDQLWDVASEICGPDYPLNPLEAFVLRGAFLLHDSALCIAAYENGLEGLRRTPEWRDAVTRQLRALGLDSLSEDLKSNPPDDIKLNAIFDVLREKHSKQAALLIDRTWKHPVNGKPILLLENSQLQEDYGKLVGQIAASHHWRISKIEEALRDVLPASASWPREWEIDPLKLACILRCADAAAIDERRAPSRLFALRPPKDNSRRHWAFQNLIYPAQLNNETLVFNSKTPFGLQLMDDWWLCFDAIKIVDEELKASNALLSAYNRPPFAARQVFGALASTDFKQKVQVEGWEPVDTSLRISDIPNLIKGLGGTKLYGDDPVALIRELLQNGCDAVRARRRRDKSFSKENSYPGSVTVRASVSADDKTVELSFEDDGIGMPPAVLTGPLLDFGTSFWNSEFASRLYPGLQSDSDFQPAGKYGIGFFSAFMFSDQVTVVSRSFLKGRDDLKTLAFKHGLSGRAQLRPYDHQLDGAFPADASTVVRTQLPKTRLFSAILPTPWMEENSSPIDIHSLLARMQGFLSRLCFSLDVTVKLQTADGGTIPINDPHYSDWNNEKFLENLTSTFLTQRSLSAKLADNIEFLISKNGRVCGRGCVPIDHSARASVYAIDGFSRTTHLLMIRGGFEGIIEQTPTVASRRDGESIATSESWKAWAQKQLGHLVARRRLFTARELYFAASHLAHFDVDLLPIAHCNLVDSFVTLEHCVKILKKNGGLAFLVTSPTVYGLTENSNALKLGEASDFCSEISDEMGELINPSYFVRSTTSDSPYERISEDHSDLSSSNILSYFLRMLENLNIRYSVSLNPAFPVGTYSGFSSNRIENGETIKARAIFVEYQPTASTPEVNKTARAPRNKTPIRTLAEGKLSP